MQESNVFTYTSKSKLENKKNEIPFMITLKTKYFRKNITKYVQDFYTKNYKTLKRKIKATQN